MTSLARAVELLGGIGRVFALTALDPTGRVAAWGRPAEELTGYPRSEVIGSHFSTMWSDRATSVLDRAREEGVVADAAYLSPRQGGRVLVSRQVAPVGDAGHGIGFLASIGPVDDSRAGVVASDRMAAAVLDTVVHPIFAAGLELNGLLSVLDEPGLRDRVTTSIEHLDEALRNLRRAVSDNALPTDPR